MVEHSLNLGSTRRPLWTWNPVAAVSAVMAVMLRWGHRRQQILTASQTQQQKEVDFYSVRDRIFAKGHHVIDTNRQELRRCTGSESPCRLASIFLILTGSNSLLHLCDRCNWQSSGDARGRWGSEWAMTWMTERPENGTENKVLYDGGSSCVLVSLLLFLPKC
jgi:hypothetical protein